MPEIHRLLCTHCTFGTSELESGAVENGMKVLGYSVRKSSLAPSDRGQLRQAYRAVERLLSYALPRDASASDKEALSAERAPRRLVFLPNIGGWQVAAQVSYRSHDTAGRPGSYFADVLLTKAPDSRNRTAESQWSPVDVLQLWSAGSDHRPRPDCDWWIDSEERLAALETEGPWRPPPLPSVTALRDTRAPVLDETMIRRFLTATADDGNLSDPIVPARWWAMAPDVRQSLVKAALHATLRGPARGGRETVTIAAEPCVAALVFYSVCRLLPPRIASAISFSTYEPSPERPLTGLVATTFMNGSRPTADLPPELAQRGFACNTFRDPTKFGRGEPATHDGYATHLVELATNGEWHTIDEMLRACDGPDVTAANLDRLIEVDRLVQRYFTGKKMTDRLSRRSQHEEKFLRVRFRATLESSLEQGVSLPKDVLLVALDWLGPDELANLWTASQAVRAQLLAYLPSDDAAVARLLEPRETRLQPPRPVLVDAIVRAAEHASPTRLPKPFLEYCERHRQADGHPDGLHELMGDVVCALPDSERDRLLREACSLPLTDVCLGVAKRLTGEAREKLSPTVASMLRDVVAQIDPNQVTDLLCRHGDAAAIVMKGQEQLHRDLEAALRKVLAGQGQCLLGNGRSRVDGILPWVKALWGREDLLTQCEAWRNLHRAIATLGSNAPPWRTFPTKPSRPDDGQLENGMIALRYLSAATHHPLLSLPSAAIHHLVADPKQQKTVSYWFRTAIEDAAKEESRYEAATLSLAPADQRSRRWMGTALIAATVTLLVAGTFIAYWFRMLDSVLPESWRHAAEAVVTSVAVKTSKTKVTEKKNKDDAADTHDEQRPGNDKKTGREDGGTVTSAPPQPAAQPMSRPALSAKDVGLTATVTDGTLVVAWDDKHPDLLDSDIRVFGQGPGSNEFKQLVAKSFDTKGCGFGTYKFKVEIRPKNGKPQELQLDHEIPEPPLGPLEKCTFDITSGKPRVTVKLKGTHPQINAYGGQVQYRLLRKGQAEPLATSDTLPAGETLVIVFNLPETFGPEDLSPPPPLTVAVATPQGTSSTPEATVVSFESDSRTMLIEALKASSYVAALKPSTAASDPDQLLVELPWRIAIDNLDLQLLCPSFTQGSVKLTQNVDGANRPRRWKVEGTDTTQTPVSLGWFTVHAPTPWTRQLRFQHETPPGAKAHGHEYCYQLLRYCRLCFVLQDKQVATCQLLAPDKRGPIQLTFGDDERLQERSLEHLVIPKLLSGAQFVASMPESRDNGVAVTLGALGQGDAILISSGEQRAVSAIGIAAGKAHVALSPLEWTPGSGKGKVRSSDLSKAEDKVRGQEDTCRKIQGELETNANQRKALNENKTMSPDEKNPRYKNFDDEEKKWKGRLTIAEQNRNASIKELSTEKEKAAFVKRVRDVKYELAEWRVVSRLAAPQATGDIPGGMEIIIAIGTESEQPMKFVPIKRQGPTDPDVVPKPPSD